MDLIHLTWPAVLGLLLAILLEAASRSRLLVIILGVAVAIWLAARVAWFWWGCRWLRWGLFPSRQRRTNVWREKTNLRTGSERL